jgi:D-sedoheptulose 7-phosphate isomerase
MSDAMIRKARESAELITGFVADYAPALERVAVVLAERFARGGRLFALGNGGSACDAQHVAVEFQHPIVEKRRALPACSLVAEMPLITAIGNDRDFADVFAAQLSLHARVSDSVLCISSSGTSANVVRAARRARELGAYTIAFTGRDGGPLADTCEQAFVVPSWSIHRIQEVHTLLLHLLWDHVHVAMGEPDVL